MGQHGAWEKQPVPATIVMGGQWGDEGKGKLTDALAARAGMVVRANGGANAGHTVETDRGVFKLHLIPSGILHPGCTCVVGAGVAVDLAKLLTEMDGLDARGIDLSNLRIADRAHVVMPWHPLLDRLEEERREDDEIGTTRTGNGPAYADKVARKGIRVADLLDDRSLRRKVITALNEKNDLLSGVYGMAPLDAGPILDDLSAGLRDQGRRVTLQGMAEGVVRRDEEPGVSAALHHGAAGAVRERPGVVGPVDGVGRALRSCQVRRAAA